MRMFLLTLEKRGPQPEQPFRLGPSFYPRRGYTLTEKKEPKSSARSRPTQHEKG